MERQRGDWLTVAIAEIDSALAVRVAQVVLGDPSITVVSCELTHLPATGGGTFQTAVYRLAGIARSSCGAVPYSCIAKIVKHVPGQDSTSYHYVQRERAAYQADEFLDQLPGNLRAPRCLAVVETPLSSILVLEDVGSDDVCGRSTEFYSQMARHLGVFNSTLDSPVGSQTWLSESVLAQELAAVGTTIDHLERSLDGRSAPHPYGAAMTRELVLTGHHSHALLAGLNRMPTGIAHLDAFSRNIVSAGDAMVLIDWALTGYAPIGADAGTTFALTVLFLDVEVSEFSALESAVFDGYSAGIASTGMQIAPRDLRCVFTSVATLRFLAMMLNAYPMVERRDPIIAEVIGSPHDQIVERWIEAHLYFVGLRDEALRLLS